MDVRPLGIVPQVIEALFIFSPKLYFLQIAYYPSASGSPTLSSVVSVLLLSPSSGFILDFVFFVS